MRLATAILGMSLLAGCDTVDWGAVQTQVSNYDAVAETRRAFAEAYQDQPFEDGAISVIAEEHGEIHTYALTPCRGNTRICGGSGGVGQLSEQPDYDIVTGAYSNRTFYLAPGGDGALYWRGAWHPLAWD